MPFGWIDAKKFLKTGDPAASQSWTAMVLDSAWATYSLPDLPKAMPSGPVNPSEANSSKSAASGLSTRGSR